MMGLIILCNLLSHGKPYVSSISTIFSIRPTRNNTTLAKLCQNVRLLLKTLLISTYIEERNDVSGKQLGFVILKSHDFRKQIFSVTNLQHTLSAGGSTGATLHLSCFRFLLMFFYKKNTYHLCLLLA